MLTKFWEELGSELGKKWLTYLLEPTLTFWGIGLLGWVYRQTTHWQALTELWQRYEEPAQVVLLVAGLLMLMASSTVMRWVQGPWLQLLEGYWPRWLSGLHQARIERVKEQLGPKKARWQVLQQQVREQGFTTLRAVDRKEYVTLDLEINLRYPPDENDLMPTALGNRLRAAEDAPRHRYGLDPVLVWPQLWLVLPPETQTALSEAHESLDAAVRLIGWGMLTFIWFLWAWWACIPALLLIAVSWLRALNAAEVYGGLLRAAFDLHRFALYTAARWPLPTDTQTEKTHGEQFTAYLFRGLSSEPVPFTPAEKEK